MTAVILAGGASRRMGRDKTALLFRGETLLQRACRRYAARFDPVWVSVRSLRPELPEAFQLPDLFPGCGPMAGLHAALSRAPEGGVFLAAADLPLADPEIALALAELGRGHDACVLPGEPLFGWYGPGVLSTAESLLRAGDYRMTRLLELVNTCFVTADELPGFDPDSLRNINDPAAYETLLWEE